MSSDIISDQTGTEKLNTSANKYNVYFALLNNGAMRREMSSTVIPAMN